jgi:hypothetical protein
MSSAFLDCPRCRKKDQTFSWFVRHHPLSSRMEIRRCDVCKGDFVTSTDGKPLVLEGENE